MVASRAQIVLDGTTARPELTLATTWLVMVCQPMLGRVMTRSARKGRLLATAFLAARAGAAYCVVCCGDADPGPVTFSNVDGSSFVTGLCRSSDCIAKLDRIAASYTLIQGYDVTLAPAPVVTA